MRLFALLSVFLATAESSAPVTRVTSERFQYSNAENSLSGSRILESDFYVYFDADVTGFDATDITLTATFVDGTGAETTPPADFGIVVDQASFTEVSPRQYKFGLEGPGGDRSTVPQPPAYPEDTIVKLVLTIPAAACTSTIGSTPNEESNMHNVTYASFFLPTFTSSMIEQVVSMTITTTREPLIIGAQTARPFVPMVVQVDGVNAPPNDYSWFIVGNEIRFQYSNAQPAQKICVAFTVADPALGDPYGSYIGQNMTGYNPDAYCYTVDADPCAIGTWSEWSACTWQCTPAPELSQFNVRTRTFVYAAGCATDTIEEEVCQPQSAFPCSSGATVFEGESGNECASNCNSDLPTPSGCKCGNGCEATDSCCQSYFRSGCKPDADTNPVYFYTNFPCWEPRVCKAGPVPNSIASGDSYCEGGLNMNYGTQTCTWTLPDQTTIAQSYNYGCACGVVADGEPFGTLPSCSSTSSGTDQCCGSAQVAFVQCPQANTTGRSSRLKDVSTGRTGRTGRTAGRTAGRGN